MINERLATLLVEQVGHELSAHQAYIGISVYFQRASLSGWGKLFHEQALEEAQHATKIVTFLVDNEIEFDLPTVRSARTTYASPAHAVRAALDAEVAVTGQFQTLGSTALAESDLRTFQFVQWFIEEQVEEERTMRALLDLLESGINPFQAEPLLAGIS